MSNALITDEEYRRFEDIIFKVWRIYKFGENEFTQTEMEHINKVFGQLNTEHHREYKIIVRHHLKRVYYTTMAREQGVSEGSESWSRTVLTIFYRSIITKNLKK